MTQFKTIDLRSDTLTIPDREMLEPILSAPLGDDGRIDAHGRGEDPTVAALEHLAAALHRERGGCPVLLWDACKHDCHSHTLCSRR